MKVKNNKCFVDASALIALNNPKDQYHQVAIEIAEKLNHIELIISDSVLSETHTFLRYRSGYPIASNLLENILVGAPFVIADVTSEARMTAMALLEKFNDQKISYCDALSVAIMQEQKIDRIFTFDDHFEVMGVQVIR